MIYKIHCCCGRNYLNPNFKTSVRSSSRTLQMYKGSLEGNFHSLVAHDVLSEMVSLLWSIVWGLHSLHPYLALTAVAEKCHFLLLLVKQLLYSILRLLLAKKSKAVEFIFNLMEFINEWGRCWKNGALYLKMSRPMCTLWREVVGRLVNNELVWIVIKSFIEFQHFLMFFHKSLAQLILK